VWTFGLYLFIIAYAISLFLLASILVPHRMQGITKSYEYFMGGRKWFFGTFLLITAIDIGDTFMKGIDWAMRLEVWYEVFTSTAVPIVGILSKRRAIQLGLAVIALALQLLIMFLDWGVLRS